MDKLKEFCFYLIDENLTDKDIEYWNNIIENFYEYQNKLYDEWHKDNFESKMKNNKI